MLRKALTLGMVFILVLSLLAVSMITCFTYDADADDQWDCEIIGWICLFGVCEPIWGNCVKVWHSHG